MAPTNTTYQDIEGSQSLLASTMEERVLELEKNMIRKPSMLVKVLCALAVAATVGIAYTTGHSVGHGAAINFAAYDEDGEDAAFGIFGPWSRAPRGYNPLPSSGSPKCYSKGSTPKCV